MHPHKTLFLQKSHQPCKYFAVVGFRRRRWFCCCRRHRRRCCYSHMLFFLFTLQSVFASHATVFLGVRTALSPRPQHHTLPPIRIIFFQQHCRCSWAKSSRTEARKHQRGGGSRVVRGANLWCNLTAQSVVQDD